VPQGSTSSPVCPSRRPGLFLLAPRHRLSGLAAPDPPLDPTGIPSASCLHDSIQKNRTGVMRCWPTTTERWRKAATPIREIVYCVAVDAGPCDHLVPL